MLTYQPIVKLMWVICFIAISVGMRVDGRTINMENYPPEVYFSIKLSQQDQLKISMLPDGTYQYCTQPDPVDWKDGAGVCFNFSKRHKTIDGYYGYPHSDSFICIRGQATGDIILGKALALSWLGQPWVSIPQKEFIWDLEGHLRLNEGAIRHQFGLGEFHENWITFKSATLDMSNFHRYGVPRMKSVFELCDWNAALR